MSTASHKNYFIERELSALARLHPTYSRRQLEECREIFLDYLDFVWKVYQRMLKDGRLQKLLTEANVNTTVNALSTDPHNPPPP